MAEGTHVQELIRLSDPADIPERLLDHEPVEFRRELAAKDIPTADSYLLYLDDRSQCISMDFIDTNHSGGEATTYSVSLLDDGSGNAPGHVAETGEDFAERLTLEDFINRCHRYLCRNFSTSETIEADIETVMANSGTELPTYVLIQELKDPLLTGIVHQTDKHHLVELGRGSFITKGAIDTSKYVLSQEYELLDKTVASQSVSYSAIEGFVVKQPLPPADRDVDLPVAVLRDILEELAVDELHAAQAIEFGIEIQDGAYCPYVIDLVDNGETQVTPAFTSDVISPGSVTGITHRAPDVTGETIDSGENVIIHHEKPDISLMSSLNSVLTDEIGFIFETGSMLCHLSTIIREQNIPAVILPSDHDIQIGDRISIQAYGDQSSVIRH